MSEGEIVLFLHFSFLGILEREKPGIGFILRLILLPHLLIT